MKAFYLVARGKINREFVENPNKCQSLLSSNGLINTDYMGSVEFEFGEIPKFYRRVMQRLEKDQESYRMIDLKDAIGLKTRKGKPFLAYIHKPDMDDFIESMSDFIEDLKGKNEVHKWHLKEWSGIDHHIVNDPFGLVDPPNAWYCIDNITNYYIGDWFMMIGRDTAKAFKKIIMHDYNNWWLTLPTGSRMENYN